MRRSRGRPACKYRIKIDFNDIEVVMGFCSRWMTTVQRDAERGRLGALGIWEWHKPKNVEWN
jgi:hypothetical protein